MLNNLRFAADEFKRQLSHHHNGTEAADKQTGASLKSGQAFFPPHGPGWKHFKDGKETVELYHNAAPLGLLD